MSISDKEREVFISLIAGACMGQFALMESTEKTTGKRVLALITPNPDNPVEASVFATMTIVDLRDTIEPVKDGDTLGMGGSPLIARVAHNPPDMDAECARCGDLKCPKNSGYKKTIN